MRRVQWGVAAGLVLGLLAWDNWQLREALAALQQASAAQAELNAARLAPLPVLSATPRADCPANPVAAPTNGGLTAAPHSADAKPVSSANTTAVEIPPGANLLEAIKIIQREQAKSQPASAAASPFGTSN